MTSSCRSVIETIARDLEQRLPQQRATQRRKLSELVSGVLVCQTPNLMELSNVLDRPTESPEARYNYVERFLKNDLVDVKTVMAAFGKDLLARLATCQANPIVMIDQSKVNNHLEILMLSVRLRKRAVPLLWMAKNTHGGIGFDEQKPLLETLQSWLPEGCKPMLAGDRFYGTSDLVHWCQNAGWSYRLRLRGNLCLYQNQGADKTLDQLKAEGHQHLESARFRSGMITHVGILQEPGHKEPWYIAMDQKPTPYTTLDYAMRWGIETMFSDFKSRGFSLTQTHIRFADRLERLVMVLSIALHWAVSMGLFREKHHQDHAEKRDAKKNIDPNFHSSKGDYVSYDDVLSSISKSNLYGFM